MTFRRFRTSLPYLCLALALVVGVSYDYRLELAHAAATQPVPGPTPRLRSPIWDYSQGPTDPQTGVKGLYLFMTLADMWSRLIEGAGIPEHGYSFGPGLVTVAVPGLPVQVMTDTAYMMHLDTNPAAPVVGAACQSSGSVWAGEAGYFYAVPNPTRTGFVWARVLSKDYLFGPLLVTSTTPAGLTQVIIDTSIMMHRVPTADYKPPPLGSVCPTKASTWAGDEGFFYCVSNADRTQYVWASLPQKPLEVAASLPNAIVGVAYSQSLIASGGVAPYSWIVTGGTLPTGLSLSSSGVLSGTATAAGQFLVTVTVTDANAVARTLTFTGSPIL